MLEGYLPIAIILILLILAMVLIFSIIPSLSEGRYKKPGISLKPSDIIKNLGNSMSPKVQDSRYMEPYETGEVSVGDFGKYVNIQYFVVVLLFVLFDVDMVLLFPWAFDFYHLGVYPFVETIIFLLMPLFAVYYAFKEGHMRWVK
jgi:NADH:ubiquinone oxidoreductase subunit 3 (subunit A)